MNCLTYKIAEFEEIKKIWQNYLWNLRTSDIESVSAIDRDGNIDMLLMKSTPIFYKCVDNQGKIIGVISGFKTSAQEFRSRGIWVDDKYRTMGIGSKLLKYIERSALDMGCTRLWSMPRKVSWDFYRKNNFKVLKEINHFEYSPHYIAMKELNED